MKENLQLLQNLINDHDILAKEGFTYEILDRSKKYPNSELLKFEADKFEGELAIYELGTNYCEYELLIPGNEKFYSQNEEFLDKKELEAILIKFLHEINEMTGTNQNAADEPGYS